MAIAGISLDEYKKTGGAYDETTGRFIDKNGWSYEPSTQHWYDPSGVPLKAPDGYDQMYDPHTGQKDPYFQGFSGPWNVGNITSGFGPGGTSLNPQTQAKAALFQTLPPEARAAMSNIGSSREQGNFLTKSVLPAALLFAGGVALAGVGAAGATAANTAGAVSGGVNSGGAFGSLAGSTGALGGGGATAAAGGAAAAGGGAAAAGGSVLSNVGSVVGKIGDIANAAGTVGQLITAVTAKPPSIPGETAAETAARAATLEDLATADAQLNSVRKRQQMGRYGSRFFRTSAQDRLGNSLYLQRAQGPAAPRTGAPNVGVPTIPTAPGVNTRGGTLTSPARGFRVLRKP